MPCTQGTPVTALQPLTCSATEVVSLPAASFRSSRSQNSPSGPSTRGGLVVFHFGVEASEQRVLTKCQNLLCQASATLTGDRDPGRRSIQNHQDTKKNAVVTRPPPALLLGGVQPGSHSHQQIAGWQGMLAQCATISYHLEPAGLVGPSDSCPPWHLPVLFYNSNPGKMTTQACLPFLN